MPEKGGGADAQSSSTGISTGMCVLFVLIAIALSVGLIWFLVVRPLKAQITKLEGELDTAVNLTADTPKSDENGDSPKGVLENAGLKNRLQLIQNGKGLITPGANYQLNKSALTLYNQQ